jgi:hypothetical protein
MEVFTMGHYRIRFKIGPNNEYVYPKAIARAVWRSSIYHPTEPIMVGDTEDQLQTEGQEIVELSPEDALKLREEWEAEYAKRDDSRRVEERPKPEQ